MVSKITIFSLGFLVLVVIVAGQNPPGTGKDGDSGIPLFLTTPHEGEGSAPGLEKGHFTFTEGGHTPAPFDRDFGAAEYRPASRTGAPPTAGASPSVVSSNTPLSYEGETTGASFGSLIVGGSNHIYPGACSASAPRGATGDCVPLAYQSNDGGATWMSTALYRIWNGATFGIGFDPAVDVGDDGTFYYSYGVAPLSGNYPNAIVMVKSTDGLNWTQTTPVTFNNNKFFDDKYYIAVDRSRNPDRVYVAWDRNTATNQILYVSYSDNGGSSWNGPFKVNDGSSKFERVIGAYPAVNQSTGKVYVSWHDYAKNKIYVDQSTNGSSWGTDRVAATTHAGFGKDIGCVGGRSQGPAHALKVGPSGTLYLVYADPVTGRGFDVLFTKSSDGVTWSTPVSLNDDTAAADQFHPTLSVDPNGSGGDRVTVTFYDRRDDVNNCLAHVYSTLSTDGGSTWSPNLKLTDSNSQSNFDGNPNGPGDYSSSTPTSVGRIGFHCVHPVGSPSGGGPFDVYGVTVP